MIDEIKARLQEAQSGQLERGIHSTQLLTDLEWLIHEAEKLAKENERLRLKLSGQHKHTLSTKLKDALWE